MQRQPVRCAVAGGAVCLQFKSSSARPCLSCLTTGDSASRSSRNMPDKKWQKQTDEDEFRQILRASASAENERNATVSGLESVRLGQHQHQHWDFGGGCHNFRSIHRRQNSSVYISTLTGSIIAMGDQTHILIFSYLVLLSDCKLLSCESRLIFLFYHL